MTFVSGPLPLLYPLQHTAKQILLSKGKSITAMGTCSVSVVLPDMAHLMPIKKSIGHNVDSQNFLLLGILILYKKEHIKRSAAHVPHTLQV